VWKQEESMAVWVNWKDAKSVDACGAALSAANDATLQALLAGPKGMGHITALSAYIETVKVEIQMNAAMGNDDKEAAGHLKAIKAYVEMSCFTAMLPDFIPVEHVHDVQEELRKHLVCAQEILQERRDDGSQKDKMDPLLAELIPLETEVARAIAVIQRGLLGGEVKFEVHMGSEG